MSIEPVYKNPENPASFGGVNALYRALDNRVKTKDIKQWLETKESYTLHKPARRRFKRNRVLVEGIEEQFQADLLDLKSLSQYNNGYKYLLTCIDVFSKYAWAIPLRDKKRDGKLITRKVPPGYYESIPDILRSMTLPAHEGKISFKFNANNKRVKIKTQNDARVVLEAGLCDVLGFHSQIVKGIEESAFVADPQAAFPIFYVYSDIVQPVVVGHVEAPLLRVVRISGDDGDAVSAQYDRPHYVPVIRQSFHTIEIEIRLNSGDLLPFERENESHHESTLRVLYKKFEDHYTNHIGSGVPYYEGVSFQKGYGLGGIFRRLFRAALPFLVKGGKAVGKEALRTGTRVVSDVLSGENFKIAARKRSEEAGRGMARKAVEHVQSMIGRGKYKRKRKKQKKVISKKAIKVKGRDIFDP
ncbi:uncharacterized protein TNCV_3483661 [Trichonephila clavipes]|nr:uncharacterized protein TNCV_3483661 [Trichonephila clavipes]